MKNLSAFVCSLLLFCVNVCESQTPSWSWGRSAVGTKYDQSSAVAADGRGNVYVCGYFSSDSLKIDQVVMHNAGLSFEDMFVAKYSANGDVLWARHFGGTADDRMMAMTVDAQGNLYVTGYFYSPTITFDSTRLTNAGSVGDICVVKLHPDGSVAWARRDGGAGLEIPHGICLDSSGHCVVVGRFSSTVMLIASDSLKQAGSMDVFIAKYDTSGIALWGRGAGSGSNDEGYAVATDPKGDIYVTGYFNQKANFSGTVLTSAGLPDIFLARYSGAGNLKSVKRWGGSADERGKALCVDAQSNVYICGAFSSTSIAFDDVTIQGDPSSLTFLCSTDSNARIRWAQAISADSRELGMTISGRRLFLGGSFNADTLTYASDMMLRRGTNELFVLCCTTDGQAQWARKQDRGGESSEFISALSFDVSGRLFVAGLFDSDSLGLGSSSLGTTRNGFDAFVACMQPGSTSVDDATEIETPLVYPQPCRGMLHVSVGLQEGTLILYSSMGEVVVQNPYSSGAIETQCDVSSFHPGMYAYQLCSASGSCSGTFIVSTP